MILLRLRFEYYVSLSTYQYRSLQESLIFNLFDRPLFWPSALGHPFRPYSSIKSRMNRFGDLKHSISIKDIQLSSFRPSTFPFQFRPVSQIIHFFDCSILTHILYSRQLENVWSPKRNPKGNWPSNWPSTFDSWPFMFLSWAPIFDLITVHHTMFNLNNWSGIKWIIL